MWMNMLTSRLESVGCEQASAGVKVILNYIKFHPTANDDSITASVESANQNMCRAQLMWFHQTSDHDENHDTLYCFLNVHSMLFKVILDENYSSKNEDRTKFPPQISHIWWGFTSSLITADYLDEYLCVAVNMTSTWVLVRIKLLNR